MRRVLSPSDVGIATVNKKDRVVSLRPTGPLLKADVKVEDEVAENGSRSRVESSLD